MNAKKCCYTIFSKVGNKNNKFVKKIVLDLQLKGGYIPYNQNPLFLGVTFDEYMCFNTHIENLRERALKRLNVIKVVSHNSWHLNLKTLTNIYSALVGSIFSYSFFMVSNAALKNLEKLQKIQNQAIRINYKLPQKSPNFKLYPISKILPIKERLISLGCRRLTKSLLKNEYTLLLTREYLDSVSGLRRSQGVYTPLCCFLPIVAIALISLGLKYAISNN